MKLIPLTQGKFAQVDDEDFEYLNQFKWYANKQPHTYYACRDVRINGKKIHFIMHRVIFNLIGHKNICDHRDHNGLNNQRSNLRPCDHTRNSHNRISKTDSTSKYLGVHWETSRSKWIAKIFSGDKAIHIGRFSDEKEAAKAYNKAAIKHHGEFANLNIID